MLFPGSSLGVLRLLVLGAILAATLTPARGGEPSGGIACFFCGDRGGADALLNVLLFLPLGTVFSGKRGAPARIIMALAVASIAIEAAQTFVPGRHTAVSDVIFNTLGATVGVVLFRARTRMLTPDAVIAGGLTLWAATVALGVAGATGYVSAPSFPQTAYHGQWTPNLGNLEWYRGEVLHATLGPVEVPPWQLPDPELFTNLLLSGTPLDISAVAGPPVQSVAPLLSVYDESQQEILLIGLADDDVVFHYRSRGADLRLDQPSYRVPGALSTVSPGDSISIRLQRASGTFTMTVNDESPTPLGPTLGSGWEFLLSGDTVPVWARGFLDFMWISMGFFPLGFWARARRETVATAIVLGAALLAIPEFTNLLPTPPIQLAAALGGMVGGLVLQRLVQYRRDCPGIEAKDHRAK